MYCEQRTSSFRGYDLGRETCLQHILLPGTGYRSKTTASQDIQEGSTDDFLNKMGLGDPDPSNHKTGFDGADEIVDWFQRDKPDDWRQRD